MKTFDFAFIGSGPSSMLTLYYTLQKLNRKREEEREIRLVVISKSNIDREWEGTYSSWVEEIKSTWIYDEFKEKCFEYKWSNVKVIDAKDRSHVIGKPYCMLDKEYLSSKCRDKIKLSSVEVFTGLITNCIELKDEVYMYLDKNDGKTTCIKTKYIINGSGHFTKDIFHNGPMGLSRTMSKRVQPFVGEKLRIINHGISTNDCTLMDYSIDFSEVDNAPPSFAYILVLDKDTIFVEETVVLCNENVSLYLLNKRLKKRIKVLLEKLNKIQEEAQVVFTEKYLLPLGGEFPIKSKFRRILSVGGAGNYGHGATGYMISFLIKRIPVIIESLLRCFKNESVFDFKYSFNCIVQSHLNDLGGLFISKATNNDQVSAIVVTLFQTPYWYEFLTRDDSFNPIAYLLNMIIFVLKIFILDASCLIILVSSVIQFLSLKVRNLILNT